MMGRSTVKLMRAVRAVINSGRTVDLLEHHDHELLRGLREAHDDVIKEQMGVDVRDGLDKLITRIAGAHELGTGDISPDQSVLLDEISRQLTTIMGEYVMQNAEQEWDKQ